MKVAIIGHRKVKDRADTVGRIYDAVTNLIENEGADTFLFGSGSEFDTLCYYVVSELKKIYPDISRVYVSAEWNYKDLNELLDSYEDTYCPNKVRGANKLCYVIRNVCMIENCDVLLTYYDDNYEPPRKRTKVPIEEHKRTKSGTQMAVEYARKKKKRIINVLDSPL